MDKKIRVRFAPSPTGPLHIGGVRTALYNYLFAKKHKGDFILRIEDTDSNRFVSGAEDYIVRSLQWCHIHFDEGVNIGGPYAPYRQSERKDLYFQYAQQLVESGFAYYAFDSSEELEQLRKNAESKGQSFFYNSTVREHLKTSLNPEFNNYKQLIERGEKWVIRFKMPANEEVHMYDLIRGEIVVNTSTLDDKVLFKSADGLPTYHLANIVDDHLMKITHVIRGEEWLPSLPLHVLLYKSLKWYDEMPEFAHLPLLLKPDGKGKLSKRDGDKMGFPVFPLHWTDPATGEISKGYDDYGFLPEAFINFLALLGWNPGTEKEIFSMEELIEEFSLERISKSGARFDFEKAKWFNHQYIQKKSNAELANLFLPELQRQGINTTPDYLIRVISLIKERLFLLTDFWKQASYFFIHPSEYDQEAVKKRWREPAPAMIAQLREILAQESNFSAENLTKIIHEFIENNKANLGSVMNALRLCIVGGSYGPDLPLIIETIGKEATLHRIDNALTNL
jgi:glutamyl-tRNA synthetase